MHFIFLSLVCPEKENMFLKGSLVLPIFLLIFVQKGAEVDCSTDDNIFGVNVLGLKAGLNTNIFSKTGPLAKAVNNLKTIKENSDNFWNNVGQNTANIINKIGTSLQGSPSGGLSVSGSVSQGGIQGSSNSGSSSTSGGGSGTINYTFPTINLNEKSWNIESQESGNIGVDGSKKIELPTITINGISTGSASDKSSGGSSTWSLPGGSTIWSLGGGSGSVSGGSSSGRLPNWILTGSSGKSSSSGSSSSENLGSLGWPLVNGGSSNSGSTIWSLKEKGSGAVSGGSSVNGGSVNSGSNSGDTSKWSLSGGSSGQSGSQVSDTGSGFLQLLGLGGSSKTSSDNSGGDSSASNSGNLVGVNVLGLKAGFCTNLFDKNGPLSKAGENLKNILEGKKITNLDDLNNVLGVNIGDMKADLTTNLFGSGQASNAKSEQEILGKSVLGLHEGLNTNIFSGKGPLANVGNDLKNLLEGKLSLGDLASGKGSAASSNKDLVGVNALGLKLALCTNLLDKNGPLAKAGVDIDSFFKDLGENNTKIWANLKKALGTGSSAGGSTTWSLGGGSGSVSGGSSSGGLSNWSLTGSSGKSSSGGSLSSETSKIGGNSGSVSGGSSSGGSSNWSLTGGLSGGSSGQSGSQISNIGSGLLGILGGGGSSKTSSVNSGGDSSTSAGNLVGVNVLGLKAGFCTNLFDKNGPLSKTGENLKNILEGKKLTNLDDLNNVLGVNIGGMKADLTTNLFGSGQASNAKSEQEILGKSILGLHEGLNTNIFSGKGPLANVGNDLKNLLEGKLSLGDLASGKGSAASSNKDLVGVNALGVKLALCTNLFDKDGPLAKAGADVGSLFKNLGETNTQIWTNLKNVLGNGSA